MKNLIRSLALFAVGYCVWLSTDAQAITLNIGSTADNTAVTLTGGYSGDKGEAHALSVINSGQTTPDGIDVVVNASTRFIATVGANRGIATQSGTATAEDAVDYGISFSVVPDCGGSMYNLSINTSRMQKCGPV
jgi:hypothetical protein